VEVEYGAMQALAEAVEDRNFNVLAYKIYNCTSAGVASLLQKPLGPLQEEDNRVGSAVRVSCEWGFAKIDNLFPFVSFGRRLNEREVGVYVQVAALLTNAYTCLYGEGCAMYFSTATSVILPPSLEAYFTQ
jgi:hypothetical protein